MRAWRINLESWGVPYDFGSMRQSTSSPAMTHENEVQVEVDWL